VSNSEKEYFAKLEQEKKDKLKADLESEATAAARAERKELHWLKCGKCGFDMETQPFRGVEIEVCNDCGAVLLDPGELEVLAGKDHGGIIAAIFSAFGDRHNSVPE
jgi:uncharacterized protein